MAPTGTTQSNESDQAQVQVVPVAPQVNVQNANVATFGDVEQGDANNANTGQAAQQENVSVGGSHAGGQVDGGRRPVPRPGRTGVREARRP